jgi:hypothetical protein
LRREEKRREGKRGERAKEKRRQRIKADLFVGSRGDGNWFEGRSMSCCCW